MFVISIPMSSIPSMSYTDRNPIEAQEVLVLDSSTFIKEIGLMSQKGSALKHYLYCRGTQFVVPQAAAEEYERHLAEHAEKKVKQIEEGLRWLARFCNGVEGWSAPGDTTIKACAKALATGKSLGAVFLEETDDTRAQAERRYHEERPPGHTKKATLGDCRIWEQCLELLSKHDVVLVSQDSDFQDRSGTSLHPLLRAEAEEAGAGRSLTFHSSMESLLQELKSEIPAIPDAEIFKFVYATSETVQELQLKREYRPTATGTIKQTRLTTDDRRFIDVRLEVEDRWESPDGATSRCFKLSGSCRYHLGDKRFDNLHETWKLTRDEPDGSSYVEGGFGRLVVCGYRGAGRIGPQPATL